MGSRVRLESLIVAVHAPDRRPQQTRLNVTSFSDPLYTVSTSSSCPQRFIVFPAYVPEVDYFHLVASPFLD